MKNLLTLLIFLVALNAQAQDSLLTELAKKHLTYMTPNGDSYSGEGWGTIREHAESSQHVLIGEDHFTKEVPEFIAAIGQDSKYDNFYIEIDP